MQHGRAGDQNDPGAAALRGLGERVAHLAAGTVTQETDGIDCFARAACGDKDDFTGEIVTAADGGQNCIGDGVRLSHAPRANHAAGQFARARLNHAHSAPAKDLRFIRVAG